MKITKSHTIKDIWTQIGNGTAKRVDTACFKEGDINNSFYRLWGEVIHIVLDQVEMSETLSFVQNSNKDLFNAHYPG